MCIYACWSLQAVNIVHMPLILAMMPCCLNQYPNERNFLLIITFHIIRWLSLSANDQNSKLPYSHTGNTLYFDGLPTTAHATYCTSCTTALPHQHTTSFEALRPTSQVARPDLHLGGDGSPELLREGPVAREHLHQTTVWCGVVWCGENYWMQEKPAGTENESSAWRSQCTHVSLSPSLRSVARLCTV